MTEAGRKPQLHKKGDRTQQEQIRKRRHNLFRRLKEFNDRYDIAIWMTMKMPSGRIYTFSTNPDEHVPTEEEMVRDIRETVLTASLLITRRQIENQLPVVHKTPADYTSKPQDLFVLRDPPPLLLPRPPYNKVSPQPTDSKNLDISIS